MSAENEQSEDVASQPLLHIVEDWYHVPTLFVVVATMAAIRLQSYDNFIRGATER
jgi:hypothetical protein